MKVCDHIKVPYSRKTVTHYRVGGTVTFEDCAEGYTLRGHTQYNCVDPGEDLDAEWDPDPDVECKCKDY